MFDIFDENMVFMNKTGIKIYQVTNDSTGIFVKLKDNIVWRSYEQVVDLFGYKKAPSLLYFRRLFILDGNK